MRRIRTAAASAAKPWSRRRPRSELDVRGRHRVDRPPVSREPTAARRTANRFGIRAPVFASTQALLPQLDVRHTPQPESSGRLPRRLQGPPGAAEEAERPAPETQREAPSESAASGSSSLSAADAFRAQPEMMQQLGIVTCGSFLTSMGYGVMVPILPSLSAELGMGATGVGILLSAPSATRLLLNLPAGAMADAGRRRACMVGGTAICAVGAFGTAYFEGSFEGIVGCRLMVGVGSAAMIAGSSLFVADLTDMMPEYRARILGVQATIINSAWVAGPALGGLLADAYGARAAFLTVGLASTLATISYYALPPDKLNADQLAAPLGFSLCDLNPRKIAASVGWVLPLLRQPEQQAVLAVTTALWLGYGAELSVVTKYAADVFDATPGTLGWLFAAGAGIGLGAAPLGGILADKFGRRSVIIPTMSLCAASIGTFALAPTAEAFYVSFGLWSLGAAMVSPAMSAFAVDVSPASGHGRGKALALHRQAGDAIWIVCPVALGVVYDQVGGAQSIVTAVVLMLGATAAFASKTKGLAIRLPAQKIP